MIIPMHELLQDAKLHHYGVAAPNVFNRETIEAAFQAGRELKAPIILDVHPVHGIYECAAIARFFERRYPEVTAALNLDHGGTYEQAVQAIHAGFSSVMVDRSTLPFRENVEQVREIVKIAHVVGVSVESELGHVGQGDEYAQTRDSGLTRPEEAAAFVKETGTDCLAVASGPPTESIEVHPSWNLGCCGPWRRSFPFPWCFMVVREQGIRIWWKRFDAGFKRST